MAYDVPLAVVLLEVESNNLPSGGAWPLDSSVFWVPRFLQPRWMREDDEQMKKGTDAYTLEYRRRILGLGPNGEHLADDQGQSRGPTS
ncbi:hypothetical protein ACX80N_16925 [Arthrobacter sp. MDT2-16]